MRRVLSRIRHARVALAFTCVLGAASACGFRSERDEGPAGSDDGSGNGADEPGSAKIDWTIAGSADPTECSAEGASEVQIFVYDQAGDIYATSSDACTAGSTTTPLPAGRYSATAAVLASDGSARTSTVDIAPFDIVGDAAYVIPIDFPASSFH